MREAGIKDTGSRIKRYRKQELKMREAVVNEREAGVKGTGSGSKTYGKRE